MMRFFFLYVAIKCQSPKIRILDRLLLVGSCHRDHKTQDGENMLKKKKGT